MLIFPWSAVVVTTTAVIMVVVVVIMAHVLCWDEDRLCAVLEPVLISAAVYVFVLTATVNVGLIPRF